MVSQIGLISSVDKPPCPMRGSAAAVLPFESLPKPPLPRQHLANQRAPQPFAKSQHRSSSMLVDGSQSLSASSPMPVAEDQSAKQWGYPHNSCRTNQRGGLVTIPRASLVTTRGERAQRF